MRSLTASVIVLLALCGCTGQAPIANGGAQPTAPVETAPALAPSAYPVPDAPTPTISEPGRPKTIDEFRSEFVRLYNQNMYAPFIELSYWGSSTGEQKKKYLSDVKAAFTLNSIRAPAIIESPAQLQAIPIGNLEDAEDRYACYPQEGNESLQVVPEPTHVLRVHAYLDTATAKEKPSAEDEGAYPGDVGGQVYDDERGYLEKEFAIGVHDGKYYFCTIKQE